MRQKHGFFSLFLLSPSSRRAWIEMVVPCAMLCALSVALLAEGVDRNFSLVVKLPPIRGRPPRGGRG